MDNDTFNALPLVYRSHTKGSATSLVAELQDGSRSFADQRLSLGKPGRRSRASRSDVLSVLVSLAFFAFGVAAVADTGLAVWLGQTNQLVVLGFVLSIMSLLTFKQAQTLMLMIEARFGQSTLQNYDAILRDETFSMQTHTTIRIALLFLFALPLILSASYKQYVGGRTTTSVAADKVIHFGPSGPPGMLSASGRSLFINATSAFHTGRNNIFREDPAFNTSYGYNMHIINETATAMLDMPFQSNMSELQSQLQHGKVLTISAPVNATFTRLNSTPESPERQNLEEYWSGIYERFEEDFVGPNYVERPTGGGTWFGMYNGWYDSTLTFIMFYNTTVNESANSTAIGFNNYRGTARGTWQIASDSIKLVSASDFETNFSPNEQYPEVTTTTGCDWELATTNPMQKAFYCAWGSWGADYDHVIAEYLIGGGDDAGYRPAPLSVWVAITAIMAWAITADRVQHFDYISPQYSYLIYTPEYEIWATVPSLHRHWGLYATLATQPLLLLIFLLTRICLHPTPVSDNFGLIALLAGIDKDSLHILKGASFSGKLRKPVVVQILEQEPLDDGSMDKGPPLVEYRLSVKGSTGQPVLGYASFPKRRDYRQIDNGLG